MKTLNETTLVALMKASLIILVATLFIISLNSCTKDEDLNPSISPFNDTICKTVYKFEAKVKQKTTMSSLQFERGAVHTITTGATALITDYNKYVTWTLRKKEGLYNNQYMVGKYTLTQTYLSGKVVVKTLVDSVNGQALVLTCRID